MVRPLRAAGHLLYLPNELGVGGQDDESHLVTSTKLGAVLVTINQRDFQPLHHKWQADVQKHSGILLCQRLETGDLFRRLDRAARLFTPEASYNQLMTLSLFQADDEARNYVTSLTSWPLPRCRSAPTPGPLSLIRVSSSPLARWRGAR